MRIQVPPCKNVTYIKVELNDHIMIMLHTFVSNFHLGLSYLQYPHQPGIMFNSCFQVSEPHTEVGGFQI